MGLAEHIRFLRDGAIADLNAAHDYYSHTLIAWGIFRREVAAGNRFHIRNQASNTWTTETELVEKSRGYVAEQLNEATFQQFLSIFENFFFDLLRLWLRAHPEGLGKKTVEFKEILKAPDKDAITLIVVDKELNEISYKGPKDWFAYLEGKVKLGCPSEDEVDRFAEAKATRDVLVHNRGLANKIYESKSGSLARYHDGERIDIPESYHRETWDLIRKVVADISDAAIAKAS